MNNGRATPLITSVCYVRLTVSEPSASARFVSDIFGLQRVADQDGEIAFRSDDRFRTVSLGQNSADGSSVGIEVWDDTALGEIGRRLRELGFMVKEATASECRGRYVQSALLTEDASGNRIDLVVRPTRSGRRYFPPRDAGIVEFHGVGLRSTDHARDLAFWRALRAEVSDWVGDIAYFADRRIAPPHRAVSIQAQWAPVCGVRSRGARSDHAEQLLHAGKPDQDRAGPRPRGGFAPDVPACRGPGRSDLLLCERHG
ncbi:MAG TPA: hypothetical protein VE111_13015 [Bradyrhizobium sp.]|nr:hypothetical protein [Bradyrhizobium sp.]